MVILDKSLNVVSSSIGGHEAFTNTGAAQKCYKARLIQSKLQEQGYMVDILDCYDQIGTVAQIVARMINER